MAHYHDVYERVYKATKRKLAEAEAKNATIAPEELAAIRDEPPEWAVELARRSEQNAAGIKQISKQSGGTTQIGTVESEGGKSSGDIQRDIFRGE